MYERAARDSPEGVRLQRYELQEDIVMTRLFPRITAMAAVSTLLAGAAVMSCTNDKKQGDVPNGGDVGALGLQLKLASGQHIDKITYKLSGGALTTPQTATVDISGESTTFSFLISSVPASANPYTVDLDGFTNELPTPLTECKGSTGGIVVTAGQVTIADVALICRNAARTSGGILVNGTVKDTCPTIDTWAADRSTVNINDTIQLTSTGHDPDMADVKTFKWSVTDSAGTFTPADGKGQNVAFKCTLPGKHTIFLTLSDGTAGCDDQVSIAINCVSQNCPNGVVDPGEACDPQAPGAPANCRTDCTLATCGDGRIDAFTGETCDDGNVVNNDGCSSTCKAEVCGDGVVQTNEKCDDGANNGKAGDRCSADCKTVTPVCNDQIIDAPETCDPPNGTTCDATCHTIVPDKCNDCDRTNTNTACNGASGTGPYSRASSDPLAAALLKCIHASRCDANGTSTPDLAFCFCGNPYDPSVCTGAGTRTGACAAQFYSAAGITVGASGASATDNQTVAGLFTDPTSPVGKAGVVVSKCEEKALLCQPSCNVTTP